MKVIKTISLILLVQFLFAQEPNAKELIQKADNLMRGESNKSEFIMKIERPSWERTIEFTSWGLGRDFSIAIVRSPKKEQGQTFLKRMNDMWSWNPKINRMIKLPPSMMSQGWMGSDYSNDDLLKESSIVVDYEHSIVGEEKIDGEDCYKIKMTPHEDAAIVWAYVLKWISKEDYFQMKTEYFDEDGYLVKTEASSDIKIMDDRKIPTKIEIIPAEEDGKKTIVIIKNVDFDIDIDESFFSQQNMKRIR